ncbi:MAG: M16 family metallopeptidase [Fidelibacterota bacterium]
MIKKVGSTIIVYLLLIGSTMAGNKYPGFKYVKMSGDIEEYRLVSNDLTVLLKEDHSAPVVTFMVTYHVGSRNEAIGYTGSTHLLEHLMFKGSRKYNKQNGKPIWTVLQNVGAQINATTWMDRTNYFELLPSEHLERAMKIESDRMRNAFLRDSDRQPEMTVVRNEFERGENDPFEALDKNIWATAYQAHPYHHSTIGWRSDIENVSTERLRQFYNTYYWPNNATVTIIGDINKKEALGMVKKYFGQYRRSPESIPEVYTTEPKQEGPRRIIVKRTGQTGIIGIAHKTPEGLNDDYYALQVLARILGGGKSSRLNKKIVDKGLATNLSMWDFPFHDNGLFITYAFLTPGTDHQKVEQIILDEYENIKSKGVTAEEVSRAIAQIRAEAAFSRDGSYSIASSLNEAIAMGDWTYYTTYVDKVQAVTAGDIQRVAQKYLQEDQSTTGYFVPENAGGSKQNDKKAAKGHHPYSISSEKLLSLATSTGGNVKAKDKFSIANQIVEQAPLPGIRLLTMKSGVEDVITITGSFFGGDEFSPESNPLIADLTAAMLDEGTKKHSKYEISDMLESVGAQLRFSSGQYRVRFNARCLKNDVPLVLSLLAEQLQVPAFGSKELDVVKKRMIGNLKRSKENTRNRASGEFLRSLYPEGHPNYRREIDADIAYVKSITSSDLKAFQRANYGLGTMTLVAVGDVDETVFSQELKKTFKDWKQSPLTMVKTNQHAKALAAKTKFITIKDKTSTDMFIGQAIGIDRDSEDYYPLMLGVYILGGNFSARLMQTIRDEQGLTYGIGSSVRGVDNGNDGYWTAWGTFAPSLLQKGEGATLDQIRMWAQKGISKEELESKKSTITGTYKVRLATTRGLAGQILTNAERGRPNEYLDEYPQIINSLDLERINNAIKKYVDLDNLVIVAAGSVNKQGQPLEK